MHYYIDGYNMLFRLMHSHDERDLQIQREQMIEDLNKKIALVKIDISLVFDATFQIGDRSRSHFNHLEILFTAEGETADEFILDELKNSTSPHQETVVTSDKKLAWQARRRLAHTESVEEFNAWLTKAYKNKLKQAKNKPKTPPTKNIPSFSAQSDPSSIPIVLSQNTAAEQCTTYYEHIFEARFQKLLKEAADQKKGKIKPTKKTPRQPKASYKKTTRPGPVEEIDKSYDEMKRWLKVFEERIDSE